MTYAVDRDGQRDIHVSLSVGLLDGVWH